MHTGNSVTYETLCSWLTDSDLLPFVALGNTDMYVCASVMRLTDVKTVQGGEMIDAFDQRAMLYIKLNFYERIWADRR